MSQAWTAEVPSGGGTLTVDGTGTQADGVRITFPPGALPGGTVIGLAADAEKVKVRDGRWAGYSLSFTVAGDPEFGQPVTVVIPIPEKMRSAIAIAYQVDPDGSTQVTEADKITLIENDEKSNVLWEGNVVIKRVSAPAPKKEETPSGDEKPPPVRIDNGARRAPRPGNPG